MPSHPIDITRLGLTGKEKRGSFRDPRFSFHKEEKGLSIVYTKMPHVP
jgi:hypothetical protein